MGEDILNFISDLFYGPFFMLANAIWNWCIGVSTGLLGTTPEGFSAEAWSYVKDTLYPWATGIGVMIMNLFFIIGFLRAVSNFKENITLELCIENLIRIVGLNVFLQKGFGIIRTLFQVASFMSGQVMRMEDVSMYTTDADVGAHLFWWLFGFGYFIVALVCGIIIILTLYGRYSKLYMLIVFFPFASSTVVAGRGVDTTAYAWLKTFLSNTFEIVVIALAMTISGMIIQGISMLEMSLPVMEYFDGFGQAFNSLLSIILMTASVKGAPAFFKQAFAL